MGKRKALFFLVVLAGVLRFVHLSAVPPSLSHDEVAIGYNAYSILKTGKDEYGTYLPLLFRSFDDYKLPGMVYATVPSVAIFGLNELGVRFPSAFFGTLTVFYFYFLIKELVEKENENIAIAATFFFAVSPWHINFSRQAFESNGALFFVVTGTYYLLKFKIRPINLVFASIFLAFSLYFYYSARIVMPSILLVFALSYRRELGKNIKVVITSLIIGIFLIIPILPNMLSPGGLFRIKTVSVVNDKNYLERQATFAKIIADNNNLLNRLVFNRRVALGITIGENYLKNLSPSHIFLTGTGSWGLIYLIEAPLFLVGFYSLFRLKNMTKWIFIVWLLTASLAGALTTDQPNPLRTLLNAPMFAFVSGLGLSNIFMKIKNTGVKKIVFGFCPLLFIPFFLRFSQNYFYTYPQANSLHFGDGYKQMVEYLMKNDSKYNKVYISGHYWRPYIFVLFWKKYDPTFYHKEGTLLHFDKYFFSAANWDKEGYDFSDKTFDFKVLGINNNGQSLVILSGGEYEVHKEKLNKIDSIDGRFAKNVFIATTLK